MHSLCGRDSIVKYQNRNVKYILRVYMVDVIRCDGPGDEGSSVDILEGRGLGLEVAEDTISEVSVAVLEGRGLRLEVAGGTIGDGGTISDGETIGDGETTSDVVFWVGHDEEPPSRLTGQEISRESIPFQTTAG